MAEVLLYESEQPEKVPVAYLRTGSSWNHGLGRYSHLLPEEASSFIVLRRMSGEALRRCCLNNDVEGLRKICRERGNPCSPDDLGLTGLMYAVFNGHLQCVKLVARNPMGVDLQGVRCSCVNLRSCKGYTALHLAMLDAPTWAARETIFVLLLSNADPLVRCTEGLTPYELALREGNALAMDAFDDFYLLSESPHPQRVPFEKRSEHSRIEVDIKVERLRLVKLQEELEKKFVLHPAEEVNWDVSVTKGMRGFQLPEFLLEPQRAGYLPGGMEVHEHQIRPLADEGNAMKGVPGLRCLEYSIRQARVSQRHRERLLQASEVDWEPMPEEERLRIEANKSRRSMRKKR